MSNQGAGVDRVNPHDAVLIHPALEGLLTSPAAGPNRELPCDYTASMGAIRFLVLIIDAGVTQFWIGEGDELPRIAGIGQHFLITSHSSVEDHFTDH